MKSMTPERKVESLPRELLSGAPLFLLQTVEEVEEWAMAEKRGSLPMAQARCQAATGQKFVISVTAIRDWSIYTGRLGYVTFKSRRRDFAYERRIVDMTKVEKALVRQLANPDWWREMHMLEPDKPLTEGD